MLQQYPSNTPCFVKMWNTFYYYFETQDNFSTWYHKYPILTSYSAYSNKIVVLRSDADSLRDSERESSRFLEVENEDLKWLKNMATLVSPAQWVSYIVSTNS